MDDDLIVFMAAWVGEFWFIKNTNYANYFIVYTNIMVRRLIMDGRHQIRKNKLEFDCSMAVIFAMEKHF